MIIQVFENNGGRPPSSSMSSNVINLGASRKRIMQLPISQSVVTLDVSPTVFEILMHKARK